MSTARSLNPHEHVGLVINAARSVSSRFDGDWIEDHVGECYLQLSAALARFDPSRRVDFGPYAMKSMAMGAHKRAMYDRGYRERGTRGRTRSLWIRRVATSSRLADALAAVRPEPVPVDPAELADEVSFAMSVFEFACARNGPAIASMLGRGLDMTQIAESIGVTKQRVQKVVQRARDIAREVC